MGRPGAAASAIWRHLLSGLWPSRYWQIALRSWCDEDEDGRQLPLDLDRIRQGFDWLVSALRLPEELVEPPSIRRSEPPFYKYPEPPEMLLLNSFFLGDLALARDLFARNIATGNLKRYLGQTVVSSRRDLLAEPDTLVEAVAPKLFPPRAGQGQGGARWSCSSRRPSIWR